MAFPAPVFMKFTNAEQHYVQIPYTEFHPDQITNAQSMAANSFTLLSKVWLSLSQFSQNSQLLNTSMCISYKIL
jgi:hypothetical protein